MVPFLCMNLSSYQEKCHKNDGRMCLQKPRQAELSATLEGHFLPSSCPAAAKPALWERWQVVPGGRRFGADVLPSFPGKVSSFQLPAGTSNGLGSAFQSYGGETASGIWASFSMHRSAGPVRSLMSKPPTIDTSLGGCV